MKKNAATQKEILIVKASGETEPFSSAKLRRSLERSKASSSAIEKIQHIIQKELVPGMKTSDIYRRAFSLLRKYERGSAGRYSLNYAIMELGPSGYPFEKLVGELFALEGFSTEVGKVVSGYCVNHEIDVIAQKDNQHLMVECKFHNQPGIKTDVKVALYIEARFQDVEKAWKQNASHAQKFHEAWLVTNTKLTTDAISYARCIGIKAIGWSYPAKDGLEVRIDRAGIHPITCLTTLSRFQKQQLLEEGIVLCKEIMDNKDKLSFLGLGESKTSTVIDEINQLCFPK